MDEREQLLDTACDDLLRYLRRSVPRQAEVVSQLGLTLHQFRALVTVAGEDGCTTTQLAENVGVHPSVATGIVQRMVARGFFDRVEDAGDRRIRRLHLTPAGKELADEVVGTARTQRRHQLEALDNAQLEQISALLRVLTEGVTRDRGLA